MPLFGNRRARILVSVFCLLSVLCVFSVLFTGAAHDCCGEDCPVCALLRRSSRGTDCGIGAQVSGLALFCLLFCGPAAFAVRSFPSCAVTPVREKTRLND